MPDGTTASTLGWSGKVRLLPLAALSGTSGAILVSSNLVAAETFALSPPGGNGQPRQMPAGLQVEQPTGFLVWCVGCSNHPAFPKERVAQIILSCHSLLPGLEWTECPANAGRTTGIERPASVSAGRSDVQSIPCFRKEARSSANCPAKARRRGRPWANAAGDYRGRLAPSVMECVR